MMISPPRSRSNRILLLALSVSLLGSLFFLSMTAMRRDGSPHPAAIDPTQPVEQATAPSSSTIIIAENDPTKTTTCSELYDCQTDRIGHESRLYPGQAICSSHKNQFAFGLSSEGIFQWHDCFSDETSAFFNGTTYLDGNSSSSSSSDLYFVMAVDASLGIYHRNNNNNKDDTTAADSLVWKSECQKHVTFFAQCLAPRPVLDCPYLHLHSGGNVVLNWIDGDGAWQDRNIQRVYPGLFGA